MGVEEASGVILRRCHPEKCRGDELNEGCDEDEERESRANPSEVVSEWNPSVVDQSRLELVHLIVQLPDFEVSCRLFEAPNSFPDEEACKEELGPPSRL